MGTNSQAREITLTNISGIVLKIDSISTPAGFQQTNNCTVVAPDAGCQLNVVFNPGVLGNYGGTLTIRDDGVGSPRAVGLSGRGIQSILGLDRSSIDFGAARIGADSSTQFVALTNTGNASMSIASVSASGDFSVSSGCGSALAAQSTCYVVAKFHPMAVGPRLGEIVIVDDAPGSPHRISLSGTGKPLQLNLSPSGLTFAAQKINSPSTPQAVTVTNDTGAPVTLGSIGVTGDFSQTNNCGTLLAADVTCTVQVTFTPRLTGSRSGTLSVVDGTGTHTVSLAGTGATSAIGVSPSTVDYGSLLVNASQSKTIVITSTGTADLNISTMQIQGFGFDYVSSCPSTLTVGKTCTVAVRFAPIAIGVAVGTLTIRDDAPGSPHVIALTGTGVQMTISVGRPDRSGRESSPVQQPTVLPVPVIVTLPAIPVTSPVLASSGESEKSERGQSEEPESSAHSLAINDKEAECKERKKLPRGARESENPGCSHPEDR